MSGIDPNAGCPANYHSKEYNNDRYRDNGQGGQADSWDTDCKIGIQLRHSNHGEWGRYYRALCGNWGCRTCRPRLEERYVQHFAELFRAQPIYLNRILDGQWEMYKKRINRNNGLYAKIPTVHTISLFSTTEIGTLLEVEEIEAVLRSAMNLKYKDRKITSSKAWQGGWHQDSAWTRDGVTNLAEEKCITIYEEENCKPKQTQTDKYDLTLPAKGSWEDQFLAGRLELK